MKKRIFLFYLSFIVLTIAAFSIGPIMRNASAATCYDETVARGVNYGKTHQCSTDSNTIAQFGFNLPVRNTGATTTLWSAIANTAGAKMECNVVYAIQYKEYWYQFYASPVTLTAMPNNYSNDFDTIVAKVERTFPSHYYLRDYRKQSMSSVSLPTGGCMHSIKSN